MAYANVGAGSLRLVGARPRALDGPGEQLLQTVSYVEVTVQKAPTAGSQVRVEWNWTGIGPKGKALIGLVVLTCGAIIRRKVFQRAFDRAVQSSSGTESR